MKNILLTGGAGYVGSTVANLLLDKGYKVTIIDNLITGHKKLVPKKAIFYNCDIANKIVVAKIINQNKFDVVMHFAGLIRIDESWKKPKKYNQYNYEKAKIFLKTCFSNGIKKVIFSSTASVYGNPKKNTVSEKDLLNPLNPYAKSKLKLENFLIQESKKQNIKYAILRYFNVAGADEKLRSGQISKYSSHLIKIASEVAIGKREEITINGDNYDTKDGTPVRDYIHVSDLANMHLIASKYLFKSKQSDIFNCGYGKGFSVKEVIEIFNKILKKKINYRVGKKRKGDCEKIISNSKKFNRIMSWKPKFNNLRYILSTAYKWEKKINS